MKKVNMLAAVAAVASLALSCEKEVLKEVEKIVYVNEDFDPEKGVLNLRFNHKVNGKPFKINTNFTDNAGNTYAFDEVRYWVSNVKLVKANGEAVAIPESYFLIENRDKLVYYGTTATNTETHVIPERIREEVIVGNVPVGNYTKLKFAIGVDPKYNNNFALKSGELDINQMAQVAGWAWHTSYIFFRTKGVFVAKGANPVSDNVAFAAETGGNDLYREVEVTLPSAIESKAGATANVELAVELLDVLKNIGVSEFSGTKPAGWAADPNFTKYVKFINASSPEQMKALADNVAASIN